MLLIDLCEKSKRHFSLEDVFDTTDKKRAFFIKKFLRNMPYKRILYVHTPFCPSKCKYCVFDSEQCSDYEKIKEFLKTIPLQIEQYKEIFEKCKFDQVYFGGGTPTILHHDDLRAVFESIPNFKSIPVKCFEASPSTITTDHLSLLEEYKFSFISLGVQSLDPRMCQKQNRPYITLEQLIAVSECLHKSKILFNYDFIAYLNRGDLADLLSLYKDLASVILYCKPSFITVHRLYQSTQTCENTRYLELILKNLLEKYPDYKCVNCNNLGNQKDYFFNTIYNAEYRLMSNEADASFSHYLWGQYSRVPVEQYDILSIGYTDKFQPVSNAGDIVFKGDSVTQIHFDPLIKLHNEEGNLYR